MTAEVAIANRSAVALAADSALTISRRVSDESGTEETVRKVYTNADKLFELLRGHAIGVMLFDSAEILAVPWETIIKSYREERVGTKPYAHAEDYLNDFCTYIEDNAQRYFPESVQKDFLLEQIGDYSADIMASCSLDLQGRVENEVGARITNAVREQVLEDRVTTLESQASEPDLQWVRQLSTDRLRTKYGARDLLQAVDTKLQRYTLKANQRRRIRDLALASLLKRTSSSPQTGLVFAGFGKDDTFPSVFKLSIGGVVDDQLMVLHADRTSISHELQSLIRPFAQMDDAATFLSGIAPELLSTIQEYWRESLQVLPRSAIEIIEAETGQFTLGERKQLFRQLRAYATDIWNRFAGHMNEMHQEYHFRPIAESAAYLSKGELAALADNIVNLASIRSRVAIDREETVGGAIDVAVISKGDGFVWVKRKHYFSPDLNPVWASRRAQEGLR